MFDPTTAARRFGTGLAPNIVAPASVDAMLSTLRGPDRAAQSIALKTFDAHWEDLQTLRKLGAARRKAKAGAAAEAADKTYRTALRGFRNEATKGLKANLARGVTTKDGFRERLVWFWADHFTVAAQMPGLRHLGAAYVEEVIRPNLTGRFADLLIAVSTHPLMLVYLDQHVSAGPSTKIGQRRGRGLNENLAREILELHTLGVTGRYSQQDVRQFAELLTGLTIAPEEGFRFRPAMAEPGAETVLGRRYGGGPATLEDIKAALEDLAMHTDTARHLAWKLAVHFLRDDPPDDLISAMAQAYLEADGSLMALYRSLLEHPSAWDTSLQNVMPPIAFIVAALRALQIPQSTLLRMDARTLRQVIYAPLQVMGQPLLQPPGPDGWPEEDAAWITPQGMAGRIGWAMRAPDKLLRGLPDPRRFLETALGPHADDRVRFAAAAAESRAEGIGLVLLSPNFQRR